jgi:anti-anti-sigma factor
MVTDTSSIFTVAETGERTVVAFRDWRSSLEGYYESGGDVFITEARREIERLKSEHECKLLVIDLTSVVFMPSWLVGLLVSLRKGGLQIELLHPSASIRDMLETTKLNRFLVVRD